MSGPGSGRYTKYVPVASPRNALLARLFNEKASDGKGEIYGKAYQTDPNEAAKVVVGVATDPDKGLFPNDGTQTGDTDMFPTGVKLDFTGSPNLTDVKWDKAGGPANSFMPDVSSPGPGKTEGVQKDVDPKISISDVKGESYVPGAPGTGTTSPSVTSPKLGSAPIAVGKKLELGKSSV